jgi:hypothetical protein
MPAEVIDRIHVLTRCNTGNGTPELMFTDRDGASLTNHKDDNSDDESYHPDEDANSIINNTMMTIIYNFRCGKQP